MASTLSPISMEGSVYNYDFKTSNTNLNHVKCGEIYYAEVDHNIIIHCLLCDLNIKSESSHSINFIKHYDSHFDVISSDIEENKKDLKVEYNSEEEYRKDKIVPIDTGDCIEVVKDFIDFEEVDQLLSNQYIKNSDDVENSVENDLVSTAAIIKKGIDQIVLPAIKKSLADNRYHCPFIDCGKTMETEKLVQTHFRNIHVLNLQIQNGKFYCILCDSSFTRKHAATAHLLKVHEILTSVEIEPNPNDLKYHCPVCGISWAKLHNINSHLKYEHENVFNELLERQQKNHIKLETITYTKNDFYFHNNIKEDGLWHCPYCNITKTVNKQQIAQHLAQDHSGIKKRRVLCEICGKELRTSGAAKQHKLVHSGEKPHKCDFCGKKFACQSNWKTHIRTHTNEKRYSCSFCDKRFVTSTDKNMHELVQHIKEKRFECQVCNRKFFKQYDLTKHTRRHTGSRPYTCEICSKSFYEGSHLKEHMLSHAEKKNFKCEICNSTFTRKISLQSHKQTHSSVKKYSCSICGQKFSQNAGLYSHKKIHHKEEARLNIAKRID